MAALLSILAFDFLLSTQSCVGVHCKQAESMFNNTLVMHSSHWMSFETLLDVKEKCFPTMCCTMLLLCMAPDNTGLNSAVDSSPW